MKKIICVGNRFAYPDSFGMEIYDRLIIDPPSGVEVVEGGVGGLSLALHFETDDPVLIVDHGTGFSKRLFSLQELSLDRVRSYDHASAFYYLLKTLKRSNIWLYLSNDAHWSKEHLAKHCDEIIKGVARL